MNKLALLYFIASITLSTSLFADESEKITAFNTTEIKKLASLIENLVPVGTVIMYGGGNIPSGWTLCDGKELAKGEYEKLFEALQCQWGCEGDLFKVPDFVSSNRFPRAAGGSLSLGTYQTNKTAINNLSVVQASYPGSQSVSVNAVSFSGNVTTTTNRHNHSIGPIDGFCGGAGAIMFREGCNRPSNRATSSVSHNHAFAKSAFNHNHSASFSKSSFNHSHGLGCGTNGDCSETRPNSIAVNYIIKVK